MPGLFLSHRTGCQFNIKAQLILLAAILDRCAAAAGRANLIIFPGIIVFSRKQPMFNFELEFHTGKRDNFMATCIY